MHENSTVLKYVFNHMFKFLEGKEKVNAIESLAGIARLGGTAGGLYKSGPQEDSGPDHFEASDSRKRS
jgi:hypothetical protein